MYVVKSREAEEQNMDDFAKQFIIKNPHVKTNGKIFELSNNPNLNFSRQDSTQQLDGQASSASGLGKVRGESESLSGRRGSGEAPPVTSSSGDTSGAAAGVGDEMAAIAKPPAPLPPQCTSVHKPPPRLSSCSSPQSPVPAGKPPAPPPPGAAGGAEGGASSSSVVSSASTSNQQSSSSGIHMDTQHRTAKYIGSFSVEGENQVQRAEYVRNRLTLMRDVSKSKPVLLIISLSGIKVCSHNGESVYMAHALKRISYATCDPEFCQFSFLAREPKGATSLQYCHAFITETPQQAEELNAAVGNSFRTAFALQRQKTATTATSAAAATPQDNNGTVTTISGATTTESGDAEGAEQDEGGPPPVVPPRSHHRASAGGAEDSPGGLRKGESDGAIRHSAPADITPLRAAPPPPGTAPSGGVGGGSSAGSSGCSSQRSNTPPSTSSTPPLQAQGSSGGGGGGAPDASAGGNTTPPASSSATPSTPHISFNQLIEQQIHEQKQKYQQASVQKQKDLEEKLSAIATPTISERVRDRRERRRREEEQMAKEHEKNVLVGKERTSWAKHIVNRARHKLPYLDDSPSPPPVSTTASPPLGVGSTSTGMGTPHSSQAITTSSPSSSSSSPAHHHHTATTAATNATRSPQHASIAAIKEVMESKDFRCHGSPVMALKETIDQHFNSQNRHTQHAAHLRYSAPAMSSPVLSNPGAATATGVPPQPLSPLAAGVAPGLGAASPPMLQGRGEGSGAADKLDGSPMVNGDDAQSSTRDLKNGSAISGNGSRPALSGGGGHRGVAPTSRPRSIAELPPASNAATSSPTAAAANSLAHINGDAAAGRPSSIAYPGETTHGQLIHRHPVTGRPLVDVQSGDLYVGTQRFDTIRDNNGVPLVIENDEQLKQMSWYQPGIPREISLEILSQQEIGSFIIRDSSHQGCYALSVKVPKFDNPTGISHYLIVPTARGGVRLKGLDKEWPSMAALVTHHTVMPEMLPCTLRLPRTAANPAFNEVDPGNDNDREDDDDYQKLADCHTMMSELKL